ncbi:UNVERIFIED_CONTAM: hypothetical protein K2H54_024867 [Gekko kuhli]
MEGDASRHIAASSSRRTLPSPAGAPAPAAAGKLDDAASPLELSPREVRPRILALLPRSLEDPDCLAGCSPGQEIHRLEGFVTSSA